MFKEEIDKLKWEIGHTEKFLKSQQQRLIMVVAILQGRIENPGIDLEWAKQARRDGEMMVKKYGKDLELFRGRLAALQAAEKAVA